MVKALPPGFSLSIDTAFRAFYNRVSIIPCHGNHKGLDGNRTMKKFAVITVCFNAEKEISDTIASILNQTCTDFEYLIKDGVSADRTVSLAESFAPAFAEKGIPYRILSQPDHGIYDAMNQALSEVQGQWVLFMNAGDLMADPYVLEMIAGSQALGTADIVYGDTIDHYDDGYVYRKALPLERMQDRLPFCHQSVYVRRPLYEESRYPLKYRLCSDYVLFFQWYRQGKRFAHLPMVMSIYDRHGLSSSNGHAVAKELLQIHEDMPDRNEETIRMLREEAAGYDRIRFRLKRFITRLTPKALRLKIRKAKGWKTEDEFSAELKRNGGRINL